MRIYDNGIYRDMTDEELSNVGEQPPIEYDEPTLDERIKNLEDKLAILNTISLLCENWIGDASPYSQVVQINGLTPNSKIDLQPTPLQLAELQDDEITLMIANDNGTATAYALGSKPTKDYEMQVSITEMKIV